MSEGEDDEFGGAKMDFGDMDDQSLEPALDQGATDFGANTDEVMEGGEAGTFDVAAEARPVGVEPGFSGAPNGKPDRRRKTVMGVPIEVVVTVGRAKPLLSDLVSLKRDSVLPLDSKLVDPVEVVIGDRVIARGELQEIDAETGRLGVRLTEVADLSQSL